MTETTLETALAAYNRGEMEQARQQAAALRQQQPSPEAIYIEAMALLGLDQHPPAAELLTAHDALFRRNIETQNLAKHAQGRLLLRQKQPERAVALLAEASTALPENQSCHLDLAEALFMLSRFQEARRAYLVGLAAGRANAGVLTNIGVCALHLQQPHEALAFFAAAWKLEPDATLAGRIGDAHVMQGQWGRAAHYFHCAAKHESKQWVWHSKLGECRKEQRRYRTALRHYEQALHVAPVAMHIAIRAARAHCLERLCRPRDARKDYEWLIAQAPQDIRFRIDLAHTYQVENDFIHALSIIDEAESIAPGHPDLIYARGFLQLLQGNWKEGWLHYEARWQTSFLGPRYQNVVAPLNSPMWDGKAPLDGKLVMALCEQGAGDLVQFAQYCRHLTERGATVDLLAPPALADLVATIPWVRQVHHNYFHIPSHDYHVSLMTMPLYEDTGVGNIPSADNHYLYPPKIRQRFAERFTVGICWTGDPKNPYNLYRSIPTHLLRSLLEAHPNMTFVSLQQGPPDHVHRSFIRQGLWLDGVSTAETFTETAAAIDAVDLVISVCTASAHIAGAMGKPVWLLLAHYADWRWVSEDPTRTRWYPTMRVFRQSKAGDWKSVLAEVSNGLTEYQAESATPQPQKRKLSKLLKKRKTG